MSTFVLVHGSWSGGWQWEPVQTRLETAGHRVLTPSLSGIGERSLQADATTDLTTHVDEVARLLELEDLTDVVLAGHSYGGMVITGAAAQTPKRIGHLVYLDAFLPRAGECAWDILPWQREAFQGLRLDDRPWLIRPVDFAQFFPELGPDFDARRLTTMPIATHSTPLPTAPDPGSIPSTYVQATAPSYFDDSAARASADGMNVLRLEVGHMLISTHPREVAQILLDAASGR